MRKLVNIDGPTLTALTLLARDQEKTVQDLIDEALRDVLRKHKRPVTTAEMFKQSVAGGGVRKQPKRRTKA